MHMTITAAAGARIRERFGNGPLRLALVYDTEGCGCAVNGVPALWIVPDDREPFPGTGRGDDAELLVDTSGAPGISLVLQRRHAVFFDERMTLDCKPGRIGYELRSDNQIYSANLTIIDKRVPTFRPI